MCSRKKSQNHPSAVTEKYFEKMAGILKTKGRLSKAILEERAKEKELEEKK